MRLEDSKQHQKKLEECIYEMSETSMDDNSIHAMAARLKEIYSNGFRHRYSDFFPVIVEIAKEDNKYNLDFLSDNLENIREIVEKDYFEEGKEFTELYLPLSKLSDHLNLEIGRYIHNSINEQQLEDIEKRNRTLRKELRDAKDDLDKAKETVSTVQTELIAVLSIFAAIVLAFSGSISFLGNALSGMTEVSLFKAAFFVLLCGFIIINLIFLMLYLVGKITKRNIYARCKTEDCTCGKNGAPACNGITRIRRRLPYVFWLNVIIISFLLLDLIPLCLNIYI